MLGTRLGKFGSGLSGDAMQAKSKSWFCLLTKPNKEIEAKIELHSIGFDVYLPLKMQSFRHMTKTGKRLRARSVMVPAKERHIFVSLGYDALKLDKLRTKTSYIDGVLCYKAEPVSFGAGVIDAWQENEHLGSFFTGHLHMESKDFAFVELAELLKVKEVA